nr:MAG: hypothetical protein [Yunnan forest noda-like virus]
MELPSIKMDYTTTSPVQAKRSYDNGHQMTGEWRDAARNWIETLITTHGMKPYAISPSSHDHPRGCLHDHIIPQDLHHRICNDPITDKHIVYGVDVDYYFEDFRFLFWTMRPGIFYTFNPIRVAGMDGDTSFTIFNNQVQYDVSGGSTWRESIWAWREMEDHVGESFWPIWVKRACGQSLCSYVAWQLCRFVAGCLGFRRLHVYKRIIRGLKGSEHRIVGFLIPAYSMIVHPKLTWLNIPKFRRMEYGDKNRLGWNRIKNVEPDDEGRMGLRVSIGREGSYYQRDYSSEVFDLSMGCVAASTITSTFGSRLPKESVLLLNQYKTHTPADTGDCCMLGAPATAPMPFHPDIAGCHIETNTWRAISCPLVNDQALVPEIKRWEALEQTIDYRVTKPLNTVVPGLTIQNYAKEFLELLVPEPGEGVPFEWDEVADTFRKPNQQAAMRSIYESMGDDAQEMIKGFIKNEPTMKPSRLISSFSDFRFILQFSAYTLSFREHVLHAEHCRHFFCPSLTPQEIARKVLEYACDVGDPMEGDFTNFDGSVSDWLQDNVGNAAYLRYFAPKYHVHLRKFLDMLRNCDAKAKHFGFRYRAGPGIKSGSPTTCDINTIINAFQMYCAIRKTYPFLTPKEAFYLVGLAFGDDSLFSARFKRAWAWVAQHLGMKLKCEVYDPLVGLSFLARVYPKPFESISSFQDPLRTMRKLHLTSRNRTVPLCDAAMDRVEGYLSMDSLTPIIGNYCRLIQRSYAGQVVSEHARLTRADRNLDKPHWFVSTGEGWPQFEEDVPDMRVVLAHRIGLSEGAVLQYDQYLGGLPNASDLQPIIRDDGKAWPYEGCILLDGTHCPILEGARRVNGGNDSDCSGCSGVDSGTLRPDEESGGTTGHGDTACDGLEQQKNVTSILRGRGGKRGARVTGDRPTFHQATIPMCSGPTSLSRGQTGGVSGRRPIGRRGARRGR